MRFFDSERLDNRHDIPFHQPPICFVHHRSLAIDCLHDTCKQFTYYAQRRQASSLDPILLLLTNSAIGWRRSEYFLKPGFAIKSQSKNRRPRTEMARQAWSLKFLERHQNRQTSATRGRASCLETTKLDLRTCHNKWCGAIVRILRESREEILRMSGNYCKEIASRLRVDCE
jgi:hypothetical protein